FVYSASPVFSFVFSGNVQAFAEFSADNYTSVTSSGQTVDLLGGATAPGGVTATVEGLATDGQFVAQQIGLNGLPLEALEQALAVPDLAYTLGLSDYTSPIWNLDFTGTASMFEITLGYAEYTNPDVGEDRLVLYHYHNGAW